MIRYIPAAIFSASLFFSSTCVQAQNDRFAYAITDINKGGSGWNALRKLDLQTGQYSQVLLNGTDNALAVYDAASKKQLSFQPDARYGQLLQTPFSTGVAAAAYDKKNNRLYFTPMFVDQLRYIDLKTMKVYYVTTEGFSGQGNMHNDEGKVITRMVIAPDGNGYAISNDGNTFIRFTTGKKLKIEQLGSLVDDPSNNGVSIHNRCTSFGGDMIADDAGNLYILSARNQVFKVNTETKMASHLGAVKNLPANFTINGAVVDADGALLVSSAVDDNSYYVVNPADWSSLRYSSNSEVYRSSDLANGNFLATPKQQVRPELQNVQVSRVFPQDKFAKLISVYPNPVTNNNIVISFNNVPNGEYTIELTDVLGRNVMQRRVTVMGDDQTQTLRLESSNAKGTYLLRVVDRDLQAVFNQKVLVQ
ncbi:MAG: T9SS type A sorting domain-containing protein [Flavisolibacter sp.]|nr:T9SS type A sorting domain-containing protein [Flavisolibacter sp.]